jgi:hypothetical protein
MDVSTALAAPTTLASASSVIASSAIASATIPSYGNQTASIATHGPQPSATGGIEESTGAASSLRVGYMMVGVAAGVMGLALA